MLELTPLAGFSDWVLLAVRLLAGTTMLYYGWPKIKDLKANARDFKKMGFKPGWLHGTLVATAEFFGGLAIIFGLLTWLAAAAFGFQMLVGTLWKIAKTDKPYTDYSYDLLLLALMLVLLTFGPGLHALSAWLAV